MNFSDDDSRLGSENGQGLVEYGLIIALIAIIIIAVLMALGPQIRDFFSEDLEAPAVEQPVETMEQELDDEDLPDDLDENGLE